MSIPHYPLKPVPFGRIYKDNPAGSAVEVVERARAVLSPRGAWMQNSETGSGPLGAKRCLIRALKDCDGVYVREAERLVLQAAKDLGYGTFSSIPSFNDSWSTTKFKVLSALDHALELANTTQGG